MSWAPLAQRLQRAALLADGLVALALAERAFGLAHRLAGLAETLRRA